MDTKTKQPRLTTLYQLYDLKAELIGGPIIPHAKEGSAIRAFSELLRNKETTPGQYPADFALISVGTQDEETGLINAHVPVTVFRGQTWLDMVNSQAANAARDTTRDATGALQADPDQTPNRG